MRPGLERIALISDVHGNLTALEAVLNDIDARGITRIFNLGDYVGKGPRGREVIDVCRERCEVNILGNWDDFLPDPRRDFDNEVLRWWFGQLSEGQGEWIRGLQFSHDLVMSGRQIRLFHASATTVHRRVRFDHDEDEFLSMFANTDATGDGPLPTVVGYGDTYDAEAELAVAKEMEMPELEAYTLELREGIYRGNLEPGETPGYHRGEAPTDRRAEMVVITPISIRRSVRRGQRGQPAPAGRPST